VTHARERQRGGAGGAWLILSPLLKILAAMSGPYCGRRVKIHGLQGKPEFNGMVGVATIYDDSKNRYTVQLSSGPIALQPKNLEPVNDDSSSNFGGGNMPGEELQSMQINISDTPSADAFIHRHGEIFLSNLPRLESQGVANLVDGELDILQVITGIFNTVGALASPEAISLVPLEFRTSFVDTVTKVLKREIASTQYQRTGVIMSPWMKVIDAIIYWLRLDDVTDRALEEADGLVGTLTIVCNNINRPPCDDLMHTCLSVCRNVALNTHSRREKFQKASSRGILLNATRGVSHRHLPVVSCAQDILEMTAGETSILRKTFQTGSPERVLAQTVLRTARNTQAKVALEKLLQLATLMDRAKAGGADSDASEASTSLCLHMCRGCSAPGATLKCSKCKQAYYCSKECQKQDWREHKTACTPSTSGGSDLNSMSKLASGYVLSNLERIRRALGTKARSGLGLVGTPYTLQELVLEVKRITLVA
jgi:hypothetical protein